MKGQLVYRKSHVDGQIGVFIGYNVSLSELERGECCCQILVAVFPCLTQGGGNTVTYRGVVGMATSGSMGWLMYLGPRNGCWVSCLQESEGTARWA